ncbi:MBL fold metallo-hydrolase [uncultured Leifsonia sp.]|uniref:MBL fold metallo-hydrolase n=1 Tax=uncultured Leifsonia sp. TaxID=340359 RepID=UPI0028D73CD0|nr:MBL fold metallo-hydrolase [uncultured Leifsonia sp.]
MTDPWAAHPQQLRADGTLELPLGGFLIRAADRTILVDAGVGPVHDGTYSGGELLNSLATHGVSPDEVTDVAFTHLHFDHIGWASLDGEPVFRQATYRVHEADWKHFVTGKNANAAAIAKLLPIAAQVEMFTADFEIVPGVSTRHSPGHTPGSTAYIVESDGERLYLLGDIAHSVVQFSERDWEVIWDVDPRAASIVRNSFADEAARTGAAIVASHFPGQRFGHVRTHPTRHFTTEA